MKLQKKNHITSYNFLTWNSLMATHHTEIKSEIPTLAFMIRSCLLTTLPLKSIFHLLTNWMPFVVACFLFRKLSNVIPSLVVVLTAPCPYNALLLDGHIVSGEMKPPQCAHPWVPKVGSRHPFVLSSRSLIFSCLLSLNRSSLRAGSTPALFATNSRHYLLSLNELYGLTGRR